LGFGSPQFSEDMETDRPDFSEGTKTVEAGHLQIEAGYTFTDNNDGGVITESHAVPGVLVRIGLAPKYELRIGWQGFIDSETTSSGDNAQSDGVGDMSIGTKFRLQENDAGWDVSSIIETSLPVGDDEVASDKHEPAVKLLFAKDLSSDLSFATNLNATYVSGSTERYYELAASASFGTDLTDTIGLFLEYYGQFPLENVPEENLHTLNGGLTLALDENLQLDAFVGTGLNAEADDFFTGFGVSFRM